MPTEGVVRFARDEAAGWSGCGFGEQRAAFFRKGF
jgi:hypothetical protein